MRFSLPLTQKKCVEKVKFHRTAQNACNSYAMYAFSILLFPNIWQTFAENFFKKVDARRFGRFSFNILFKGPNKLNEK